MSYLQNSLIGLGKAVLRVVGLNPQRLGTMSEARIPAQPTFGGMDYQATGLGDQSLRLECVTFPHVMGGLDAVGWLLHYHNQQEPVNFIRIGSNFLGKNLGQVRIRHLFIDETHLHPVDHVGRKFGVEVDLLFINKVVMPEGSQSNSSGVISA